jgi:hypothetical protein
MIRKALGENDPQDDTGYESGNSHKNNAGAKIDTLDAGSTTSTSSSKATTTKLNASISVNCITSTSL